jgi:CheY-like chemotaxis protein
MFRLSHEAKTARTIAHDFNNLLFAISGHSQCLSELLPADGRPRLHTQEIVDAAKRGLALVEELRALFPDRAALRAEPLASTDRILLVESEPSLRELMKDVLVRQGYDIRTAADAAEAVAACEHEPADFQLLITDFTSQGITGPELADVLRGRTPGIRVLFMSDAVDDAAMEHARAEGASFVAKPLSAAALTRSVHHALEGCHAV